jgi:hypothetical protein
MRHAFERLIDWFTTTADRLAAWGTRLVQGRGVGRAWLVVGCLATVPMLGFGALQAAGTLAHEERTEVVEVDAAAIDGLIVDNGAGSVRVVGIDGADTITVSARISEGLRATGHRISERDGVLVVRGSCPLFGSEWCGVDYTVEVPTDMYVDVHGRDRISISDLSAGLTADSSASSIELARIGGNITADVDQGRLVGTALTAGSVDVSADQGSVTLDFTESPDEIVADADQGSVDIALPDEEGVVYATEASSDQGTVSNRIRVDPSSDRSIAVNADQGSITITYALP